MKKLFVILLSAVMALSAVSCSGKNAEEGAAAENTATAADEINDDNIPATVTEEAAEEEATDEEAVSTLTEVPENVEISSIYDLELSQPAEVINGTIVMYFTDEEIYYESDAPCNIGLISTDAADSIGGTLDMTSYPDMFDGDNYRGAAVVPNEPLPTGSYTFSISFGNYLVTFDMTVD